MASACDSQKSERKVTPMKQRSSSKKIIHSSDEEINICSTPLSADNCTNSNRYPHRKRRQRFQIPSKEEQWKKIETSSVSSSVTHLKPRKLINDFMRETHRYNYDYIEVSGEESMEGFIKSSSESTDSQITDETESDIQKTHRVKGYRPRIAKISDSSEEDDSKAADSEGGSHPAKNDDLPSEKENQAVTNMNCKKITENNLENDDVCTSLISEGSKVHSRQKAKKQSVTASSSEKHSSGSSAEEESQHIKTRKIRAKSALDSDSDSEQKQPKPETVACRGQEGNKKDERSCKAESSGQTTSKSLLSSNQKCQKRQCSDTGYEDESTTNSGSSADSGSETSSIEGQGGRIRKLAAQKRKKVENLFGRLKSARAKHQKP